MSNLMYQILSTQEGRDLEKKQYLIKIEIAESDQTNGCAHINVYVKEEHKILLEGLETAIKRHLSTFKKSK